MYKFVAFLRGINVSGQKKIVMQDLRDLMQTAGFKNVTSYIQSGNLVMSTDLQEKKNILKSRIEQAITAAYGFAVPCLILFPDELDTIIRDNPFVKNESTDTTRLYVTLLADTPDPEKVTAIDPGTYLPDEFNVCGNLIYLHVKNGYGKSKLTNNFFESKLKVKATSRNWKTMLTLSKMCRESI